MPVLLDSMRTILPMGPRWSHRDSDEIGLNEIYSFYRIISLDNLQGRIEGDTCRP